MIPTAQERGHSIRQQERDRGQCKESRQYWGMWTVEGIVLVRHSAGGDRGSGHWDEGKGSGEDETAGGVGGGDRQR